MWLTDAQAQAIVRHAREEAPREACGIIAGRNGHAAEIIPIPNAAADPIHSYYMDEHRLAAALMGLEAHGLELIGFYHSHPQSDPIPSPTDVKHAHYPNTPHLIVGLKRGEAQLAVWQMRYSEVTPMVLHIGTEPAPIDNPPLSSAQKTAILMGALIAFALMIIISLSLLPPAPLIPR